MQNPQNTSADFALRKEERKNEKDNLKHITYMIWDKCEEKKGQILKKS
jgi:hypothetical protein